MLTIWQSQFDMLILPTFFLENVCIYLNYHPEHLNMEPNNMNLDKSDLGSYYILSEYKLAKYTTVSRLESRRHWL